MNTRFPTMDPTILHPSQTAPSKWSTSAILKRSLIFSRQLNQPVHNWFKSPALGTKAVTNRFLRSRFSSAALELLARYQRSWDFTVQPTVCVSHNRFDEFLYCYSSCQHTNERVQETPQRRVVLTSNFVKLPAEMCETDRPKADAQFGGIRWYRGDAILLLSNFATKI